jgi:hypothetical protein
MCRVEMHEANRVAISGQPNPHKRKFAHLESAWSCRQDSETCDVVWAPFEDDEVSMASVLHPSPKPHQVLEPRQKCMQELERHAAVCHPAPHLSTAPPSPLTHWQPDLISRIPRFIRSQITDDQKKTLQKRRRKREKILRPYFVIIPAKLAEAVTDTRTSGNLCGRKKRQDVR